MARVMAYVVCVVLGTWFGGAAALILFVTALFTKARAVATDAAPVLFGTFEAYQLALAAVALVALVLWRWAGGGRLTTLALGLTMTASVLAAVQAAYVTPTINAARLTDRPTFDRYHRLASANYTTTAGLVLAAWLVALAATRRPTATAVPVPGSPAAPPDRAGPTIIG